MERETVPKPPDCADQRKDDAFCRPAAPHPLLKLQRAVGNQAVQALVQTKLRGEATNNPFEREAENVCRLPNTGAASLTLNRPEPSVCSMYGASNPFDSMSKPPAPDPLKPAIAPLSEYNPCLVDVSALTNAELLLHWERARAYVKTYKRGEGDFYDYANLLRRLVPERRKRIHQGHVWMAEENIASVPERLYLLRPGGPQLVIVEKANAREEALGTDPPPSTSVLSASQFDSYLERMHIPRLSVEEYYGRQAFGANQEPLSLVTPPPPPMLDTGLGFSLLGSPFGVPSRSSDLLGASGVLGMGASDLYASPFDLTTRGAFLRQVYSSRVTMTNPASVAGAELTWRGAFPEKSVHGGTYADLWQYRDLNDVRPNFRVFDTASRFSPDQLISTTHSLPNPLTGQVNMSHYREKFRIMMGNAETRKMTQALGNLNRFYGTSLTVQDVNRRNFLAVPDDHVAQVRLDIQSAIDGQGARATSYSNMLNVLLMDNPVTINMTTFSSWNQVQAARTNGSLSVSDYQALRQILARQASQRIIPAGITIPEILATQNIATALERNGYGLGGKNVLAPPELLQVRRLVAMGVSAEAAISQVARGSMGRGAAIGGGASLGVGAVQAAFSDDPNRWRNLAVNVPLSAAVGAGDAWAMAQFNTRLMNPLLTRAMAGGASPAFVTGAGLAGRTLASTGVGAVAAPVVTLGAMGIDDLFLGGEYTKIDYAAVGARTAVSGGMAAGGGFLATVGVSTLAGSEVPLLGNAVGFVVGLGIYFAADRTVGKDVEDSVRESMGEYGCLGTPYARVR